MNAEGLWYFELLKQEIASVFRIRYPDCNRTFEDWTGQDISNFQEELRINVKGRISEKWFYTHLKNPNTDKLPRVDVLNLLSEYTGYKDWDDFKSNKGDPDKGQVNKIRDGLQGNKKSSRTKKWAVAFLLLVTAVAMYLINDNMNSKPVYKFKFVDADNNMPITQSQIQITILREGESPISAVCDSTGCFEIQESVEKIVFVVAAPYYKTDTVVRNIIFSEGSETVKLRTDDYALMIHVFSNSKVKDWEKRRQQLQNMLADDVQVIQVSGTEERGMEMYNKEEFIDKLTTPIGSLKNVEVLETQYQNNKISWIRFKQAE